MLQAAQCTSTKALRLRRGEMNKAASTTAVPGGGTALAGHAGIWDDMGKTDGKVPSYLEAAVPSGRWAGRVGRS